MKVFIFVAVALVGLSLPVSSPAMNKGELIEALAGSSGLSRADATRAVDAVLEQITLTLARGGSVSLAGFGTFKVKVRAARMGRNPRTGEAIHIPAHNVPGFKAGKGLKGAVNVLQMGSDDTVKVLQEEDPVSESQCCVLSSPVMNKGEFIEAVAGSSGLSRADSTKAVDGFLDTVTRTLAGGGDVSLVGFGTFLVKARAARMGRNPKTGEAIHIKASKVPGFKAGKGLKGAVNVPQEEDPVSESQCCVSRKRPQTEDNSAVIKPESHQRLDSKPDFEVDDVERRVRKVVSEQIGVKEDEVVPTASIIDDLGADSLDAVELVMALEEEFEVEISDEDAERLDTVHDIIDYIRTRLASTVSQLNQPAQHRLFVRDATLSDLACLSEITTNSWQAAHAEILQPDLLDVGNLEFFRLRWDELLCNHIDKRSCLVVCSKNRILGVGACGPYRFVRSGAAEEFEPIATNRRYGEFYRGYAERGVPMRKWAELLFVNCAKRMVEDGFEHAGLWTNSANTRMRRFAEAMGGSYVTHRPATILGHVVPSQSEVLYSFELTRLHTGDSSLGRI